MPSKAAMRCSCGTGLTETQDPDYWLCPSCQSMYPGLEGAPYERIAPLMERYWSRPKGWRFEGRPRNTGWGWARLTPYEVLAGGDTVCDIEIRLVPITRAVVAELPEPVREAPRAGQIYWTVYPATEGKRAQPVQSEWVGDSTDYNRFHSGMIWLTKEEVQEFLNAIAGVKKKAGQA